MMFNIVKKMQLKSQFQDFLKKKQNEGGREKISKGQPGVRGEAEDKGEGRGTILCATTIIDARHYTLIKTHRMHKTDP